jgi:hypothetical protein
MLNMDDPKTFRAYAVLFEPMATSDATLSAATALPFQADEIERRKCAAQLTNAVASDDDRCCA